MKQLVPILTTLLILFCLNSCSVKYYESVSSPIEHGMWTTLLQKHVDAMGNVDYRGFIRDSVALNEYLDLLSSHHPNRKNWSEQERLAYWINAYNAFTVKLITDHYPIKSIKDIKRGIIFINTVWDIKFINIEGQEYTLNNIEHGIIRKRFKEPRMHCAINCASISCPALLNEAFEANQLEQQLTEVTRAFLADESRNKITENVVQLSKIFSWFSGDFKTGGYKGVLDFVNKHTDTNVSTDAKKSYLDYNWALNELQSGTRPPGEEEVPLDPSGRDSIFTLIADGPRFPGCENQGLEANTLQECAERKLINFTHRTRRYPQEAASEGIEGKVLIKVVVNEDGTLSNPRLSGVTHHGLGEAALEVLENMPIWIPGKYNGQVVKAYATIPVSFYLE